MRTRLAVLLGVTGLHLLAFVFLYLLDTASRNQVLTPSLSSNKGQYNKHTANTGSSSVIPIISRAGRPPPTTDEVLASIDKAGNMGTKPSIFWTAFPYDSPLKTRGYTVAKTWATERFGGRCNFVLYDNAMLNSDYVAWNTQDERDPQTAEQGMLSTQHMSKAFALRSSGTVYVIIPDHQNAIPTSTWKIWEAPILTRTGRVDKIIRVGWPSKQEVPIWWPSVGPLYVEAPPGKS